MKKKIKVGKLNKGFSVWEQVLWDNNKFINKNAKVKKIKIKTIKCPKKKNGCVSNYEIRVGAPTSRRPLST